MSTTEIEQRMRGADRQAEEAMLRAEEVARSIKVSDVQPRPLPSLREDSMESMESMKSIESSKSMASAKRVGEAKDEDYCKGKDYAWCPKFVE